MLCLSLFTATTSKNQSNSNITRKFMADVPHHVPAVRHLFVVEAPIVREDLIFTGRDHGPPRIADVSATFKRLAGSKMRMRCQFWRVLAKFSSESLSGTIQNVMKMTKT